ncbi:MAG: hypothetical protein II194_08080 [Bacteroidales bacterium]|nr:hypothetical protein [Bacteroidales bacterium]
MIKRFVNIFFAALAVLLCTACGNRLKLTPFEELNQGDAPLNSHKGSYDRSSVKLMHSTFNLLPADSVSLKWPSYPRVRVLPDGSYILFWQEGLKAGDGNGRHTRYAKSDDLVNWQHQGYLWECENVVNGLGDEDIRVYTNANGLVLSTGELMVCSSFRTVYTYNKPEYKSEQGLKVKFSKDGGLTWYGEQTIYHGPNWEAHLMETRDGEIQVYFSESRPWTSWSHSGTSLVYSKDGGKTWLPELGEKPLRVMRKNWWCEDLGRNLLTDQMPVGIRLNGTDQMAFAMETVTGRVKNKQSFSTSIVFSPEDGKWIPIEDEETSDSPTYRLDNVDDNGNASGPYLVQLHSGETVLLLTTRGKIYTKVGDERAHNWSETSPRPIFPDWAGWPGAEMETSHTMLATTVQRPGGGEKTIGVVRLALNHDITATPRRVRINGKTGEWKNTDEALFLGEFSDAYATVRASQDKDNIYLLVEVSDTDMAASDYVALMLAETGSLTSDALTINVSADGLLISDKGGLKVDSIVSARMAEGTLDEDGDTDKGWAVEIAVPRNIFTIKDSALALNAILYDNASEREDFLSEPLKGGLTTNWKYVKGL